MADHIQKGFENAQVPKMRAHKMSGVSMLAVTLQNNSNL